MRQFKIKIMNQIYYSLKKFQQTMNNIKYNHKLIRYMKSFQIVKKNYWYFILYRMKPLNIKILLQDISYNQNNNNKFSDNNKLKMKYFYDSNKDYNKKFKNMKIL